MTFTGGDGTARARIRIAVEVAAPVIGPVWPLRSFIAVDPLDGLVDLDFETAAAQAQRWLRASCIPDLGWLRAAHQAGRITDADLRAVLARHPSLGDDEVAAFLSELLECPAARPPPRTAAERCDERLGTDLAATVDAMVATWCAAFVDEGAAAWPMAGRGGVFTARDGAWLRTIRVCGASSGVAPALSCAACRSIPRTPSSRHSTTSACPPSPSGMSSEVSCAVCPDGPAMPAGAKTGPPTTTPHLAPASSTSWPCVSCMNAWQSEPPAPNPVRSLVPSTPNQEGDLARAGGRLAAERVRALPGGRDHRPAAHAAARAHDWTEVRPEWGLARNAAFVVGPRSMTVGLDLGCRAFLHSYDAAVDPPGTALETILTAPMVVAQWINAQYYFSTVDPDVFGAGDKTLHNPVVGVGVLLGGGGDLRAGLPRQSVLDGDDPYHEPMRLLTVVQAPLELIAAVVDRNDVLRHLFDGGWVI